MTLREIVYLDRVRVESYISQLAGGVVVETSESTTDSQQHSAKLGISTPILRVDLGRDAGEAGTQSVKMIPAHAALTTLESLLKSHSLLADAGTTTVVPGQVAYFHGDATFESWGLLASLADSVQGVATLGAKIYSAQYGTKTVNDLNQRLKQLEALIKRYKNNEEAVAAPRRELRDAVLKTGWLSIVSGNYINDAKDIVRLFFQDQNHVRISSGGKTFVGLMRRDNLVGSTMEEILFDYGSKPKVAFGAIFYVTEFGRAEAMTVDDFKERFGNMGGPPLSFALLQSAIRTVGTAVLELAEEIRRPAGENAAFVVPLALFREIRHSGGTA